MISLFEKLQNNTVPLDVISSVRKELLLACRLAGYTEIYRVGSDNVWIRLAIIEKSPNPQGVYRIRSEIDYADVEEIFEKILIEHLKKNVNYFHSLYEEEQGIIRALCANDRQSIKVKSINGRDWITIDHECHPMTCGVYRIKSKSKCGVEVNISGGSQPKDPGQVYMNGELVGSLVSWNWTNSEYNTESNIKILTKEPINFSKTFNIQTNYDPDGQQIVPDVQPDVASVVEPQSSPIVEVCEGSYILATLGGMFLLALFLIAIFLFPSIAIPIYIASIVIINIIEYTEGYGENDIWDDVILTIFAPFFLFGCVCYCIASIL